MKIIVKKNLGNSQLEIECEGKDEKEALAKATFFTQPDYCGLCKATNIVWSSNKAQAKDGSGVFTYIKRKCLKCGAESTAGEYKDGGLFWKAWEIYKPDDHISEDKDLGMPEEGKPEIPVVESDPNLNTQNEQPTS